MYEADPRVRAFDRLQATHSAVHQVLRRNPLFAGYTHHRNHAAVYLLPRVKGSFPAFLRELSRAVMPTMGLFGFQTSAGTKTIFHKG